MGSCIEIYATNHNVINYVISTYYDHTYDNLYDNYTVRKYHDMVFTHMFMDHIYVYHIHIHTTDNYATLHTVTYAMYVCYVLFGMFGIVYVMCAQST